MQENNPFFGAVRFLTIFPVPGRIGTSEQALARALPSFPLVGVGLGTLAVLLGYCFWDLFDPGLAAVFMVATLLFFSGGLHCDGLADSADGFFSSRPREQMLEIMRDSRIGVMGVVWVLVIFLAKVAALAGMPMKKALITVFLMPIAGRCLMVVMMALLPYVRQKNGLAAIFYDKAKGWCLCWSVIVLTSAGWLTAGFSGLYACAAAIVILLLFIWFCKEKIGGATGDTLGASCELAETAIAVAMSSLV